MMPTVSELMAKNISNAQANIQAWGNVIYNVKAHGAKGDGKTDDTNAIQECIDKAKAAGGGVVYFPAGTYMVSGLELKSDVVLQGAGKDATIIKLIDDSNQHVVYTTNFDELVGTSPSEGDYGVAGAGLRYLKIDGNGDKQTKEKHGLAYFGIDCVLEDVAITNARGWGIYREAPGVWYQPGGWSAYGRNAQDDIRYIEVYENWMGNFYYNGQSDSTLVSVLCYRVRGTKESIPGLANLWIGPKSNGMRLFGAHCWGDSDYGIVNEALLATFTNCHVESAAVAKVWVKAPIMFYGRVYEVASNTAAPAFMIEPGFAGNKIIAAISNCKIAVRFVGSDAGYGLYDITQYSSDVESELFVFGTGGLGNTNIVRAQLYGANSKNVFVTPYIRQVPGSPIQYHTNGENHVFYTGGNSPQFSIDNVVNNNAYIAVAGSNDGPGPAILVRGGTQENLDLRLIPKGDGKVRFGTYTSGSGSISGYIEIKDSSGIVRKLAVIS